MNEDHKLILETLVTVNDRDFFIDAVEQCTNMLYDTKANLKDILGEYFTREQQLALIKILEKESLSPHAIQKLFQDIRSQIQKLPVFQMTIAVPITSKTTDKIYDFLIHNSGNYILLDIRVNPELIAGATVAFEGTFKDYSLLKEIAHVA